MNTLQTLAGMSLIVVVQGCLLRDTNARSTPHEPGANLHLASSPLEYEESFPVAPALELPAWISTYEKGGAGNELSPRLREKEAQWLELRKNGKTMWGSEKWMKEPDYYRRLSTRQLIHECFERPIIGFELMKYDDANLGLLSAKTFHNGFAELLGRKDLADGIIFAFEQSAAMIADPTNDLPTAVRASVNIECLCTLCRLSPVRDQIKGREASMLSTCVQVLKSYKAILNARMSGKESESSLGFFCEPCNVATMALVFLKQIDPAKYEAIAPTIRRVRFPKAQREQDLRAYCEMILTYLESGEEQRKHNRVGGEAVVLAPLTGGTADNCL
jgi:hypothetical protein